MLHRRRDRSGGRPHVGERRAEHAEAGGGVGGHATAPQRSARQQTEPQPAQAVHRLLVAAGEPAGLGGQQLLVDDAGVLAEPGDGPHAVVLAQLGPPAPGRRRQAGIRPATGR